VVLSGVFSDPWVLALDPKVRNQASHEVSLPLRVFQRVPYRLFGSPDPLRRFDVHEVFRLASSPPSIESGSSSHRLQILFRDPVRVLPAWVNDGKPSMSVIELLP
jgi:hypothetical protein